MTYKILGSVWWTPPLPGLSVLGQAVVGDSGLAIGAIAIESYQDGSWKVYMGYGQSKDEHADCQNIAAHGMPIGNKEAACGLFPDLPADKFKY